MSDMGTDLAGSLAVEIHRRVGELVVVFQGIAADQDMPLTERQACLLAATASQVFDGTEDALASQLSVEASLRTGGLNWLIGYDPGALS